MVDLLPLLNQPVIEFDPIFVTIAILIGLREMRKHISIRTLSDGPKLDLFI